MNVSASEIIAFWFSPRVAGHWFASTPELDAEICARFERTWEQATGGEKDHWQDNPDGCLALAIVLDQFPLNMFRGQAISFSTEARAIEVARHAVNAGFDKRIATDKLTFLYMPLMHSESLKDQDLSVRLFTAAELGENARFAQHHKEIVERFGRFPHRNVILGRESTDAEIAWLASDAAFRG